MVAEVRRLLASVTAGAALFDESVAREVSVALGNGRPPAGPGMAGRRFGPWQVDRLLGEGGMGAVFLAHRADGAYEQRVALKRLRGFAGDGEAVRRFAVERQVLARLEHPGITRVLDGGESEDGVPYLVMELVEGEPLDVACDRRRLPVAARLEVVAEVCAAVQYAHRALVLHRDLKPSNVLLTEEGRPKLLDFGIAKLLVEEAAGAPAPTVTVAHARPFTPEYASPEQILGEPVSTATDVYSLGVVLYELLVGERPFPGVQPGSAAEIVRNVERRRAEPPSRRLAGLAAGAAAELAARRSTSPRGLARALAGDVDRIVLQALDPDPALRYASAAELAEDLSRHLAGLPVRARPATFAYRARKFVRRHRVGVGVAALIATLVLGGFGTAVWQWRASAEATRRAELAAQQARQAAAEALRATERARSTNRFLVSLFAAGGDRWWVDREHKGPETRILDVLDEASRRLDTDLDTGPVERADLHHVLGETFLTLHLAPRAVRHFERSLQLRRSALGEVHEDTARAWYYASTIAPTLGEQVARIRRSVAVEERLRRRSTNYPWALADGAALLAQAGHADEAAAWLARLAPIAAARDARDPLRFATHAAGIEVAYQAGDLDLAGQRVRTAMAEWRDHPSGQLPAAEFARHGLRIQRLLGRLEPDAIRALVEVDPGKWPPLVAALVRVGDTAAAARLAPAASEDPERLAATWFHEGPQLAALAGLRRAQGDAAACEALARHAVELMRPQVVRPTVGFAEPLVELGECRALRGDVSGAVAALGEAHGILVATAGPEVAETQRVAALLAAARGRVGTSAPPAAPSPS